MKKYTLILATLLTVNATKTNAQNIALKGNWQIIEIQLLGLKSHPNFILNDTIDMLKELITSFKLEDTLKEFTLKDSIDAQNEVQTFYNIRNIAINYSGVKKFKTYFLTDNSISSNGTYTYNAKQKKLISITIEKRKTKTEVVTAFIKEDKLYISNKESNSVYQKIN